MCFYFIVVERSDTVKLFRNIDPYLRKMSDKLYLREMSSFQWEHYLQNEHDTSISLIPSNGKIPLMMMMMIMCNF